ncbi:MAG: efflux RND transporter periplasmic adaptor subunit [Gammaproteobacteria bacterium]|nr:efflux RND transporter periplasmic adaptor subunit [Gammaproteobacteria bacterium]MBU1490459.1 efflux RND transporter periplasmic adaptor subunit [Gammaproteobacteria bacterium]MBU2140298.1 efflux RND transporter periplasmic adaptor subunit [Gammaproteobacteria bacterium]MBU2217147.1 efflux RND transporter periplasmic adaptor subunit [Gammaproteobacteria bacterium]
MFSALSKRPWLIAVALTLALVLWLFSGALLEARDTPTADLPAPEQGLPRVEVQWLEAEPMQRQHVVQGQIEPWRRVELRAQISASVIRLDRDKGSPVAAGERLLSLSPDDRATQVARSEADVRQRETDVSAAKRLRERNLFSANELLRLDSELAKARAELDSARLQMRYTQINAPFAGVYDARAVELGDFVQPGQSLLTLVDIAQLKVSAQIAQQQVTQLRLGQPVRVQLLDGRELEGDLHFIAAAADPGSRSFRIEVRVPNPESLRLAGASATLQIQTGETLAHRLSPALLSLDQAGRNGVKWVDEQQRVVFSPVELLSVDTDGAWVAGLPPRVALITLGQGFVEPGQQVQTRLAGEAR